METSGQVVPAAKWSISLNLYYLGSNTSRTCEQSKPARRDVQDPMEKGKQEVAIVLKLSEVRNHFSASFPKSNACFYSGYKGVLSGRSSCRSQL